MRYRTTAGIEPERSVLTSSSIYGKEGALQNVYFEVHPHVVIICTQDVLQLILTLYSLVVILRLDIAPQSVSAK